MRVCFALVISLPFAALTVTGCGGGGGGETTGPPGDLSGARLEFVASQTQTLGFGETAELRVRYVRPDDSPISGATLGYEIVGGAPAGSSLSARAATTGDMGEAAVDLTAGDTRANLEVQVTPPEGDPVRFVVAVTDEEAGSVVVDMSYDGTLGFDEFEPLLFRGEACGGLDPASLPTAEIAGAPAGDIDDRPGFAGVPVASDYTVAVVANIGGEVRGFGCTDGVEVRDQEETKVPVTIEDLGETRLVVGIYDLDNRLDFGDTLPAQIGAAVDLLDEMTDDEDIDGVACTESCGFPCDADCGQDPGAFVVDLAMRQTCAWECLDGEDDESCSEINHPRGDMSALYRYNMRTWEGGRGRGFGGCGTWEDAGIPAQNIVNDEITSVVPDIVLRIATIAGDIARSINNAHIYSALSLDAADAGGLAPMEHDLLEMDVTYHDLDGVEHTDTFSLFEAGVAMETAEGMAMIDGTTVTIPSHTFSIDWGDLIQYIWTDVVIPGLGYTDTADLLDDLIDCSEVARRLATSVGVLTESQYEDYCDSAIMLGGDTFDVGFGGLVTDAEGTLTLEGSATAADFDDMDVAQSLDDGGWTGMWGEMGMTGDITGTFTGTRR